MNRKPGLGRARLLNRQRQSEEIDQLTSRIDQASIGGRYRRDAVKHNPRQLSDGSGENSNGDSGKGQSGSSQEPTSSGDGIPRMSLEQAVMTREERKIKELDDEEYKDYTKFVSSELGERIRNSVETGRFQGTSGTPIALSTNFFRCNLGVMNSNEKYIYQYRVDFHPITDNVPLKKEMIEHVLTTQNSGVSIHMFEGTMIFTIESLRCLEYELDYENEKTGETINYTIKFTLSNRCIPNNPLGIQVVNLINRQNCKENLEMEQVQRNFYMKSRAAQVESGGKTFEVWPGYTFSINIYEAGLFLVSNVRAKVMPNYNVLDILNATYIECRDKLQSGRCSNISFNELFRTEAIRRVCGIQVRTMFNNKTYRIDDVDFRLNPTSILERTNGETMTYLEYYQKEWTHEIRDHRQPLLVNRPKKRQQRRAAGSDVNYLIPEMCQLTGLDEQTRKDFKAMRDLAVHTRKSPMQRAKELRKFINYMHGKTRTSGVNGAKSREFMEKWDLQIGEEEGDTELFKMEGRELRAEPLIMNDPRRLQPVEIPGSREGDWDRTVKEWHMLDSKHLKYWTFITTQRDQDIAARFFNNLKEQARRIGFTIENPEVITADHDRKDSFIKAIRTGIDKIGHKHRCAPQLVFCLLPNRKADTYAAVKKMCCLDERTPIASQCLLVSTIRAEDKIVAVATKVAIQMNCKLGGEPWMIQQKAANTMIIGIDTYHDTDRKGKNITGFVSSLNKNCTQWYSQTVMQSSKQEISDGLGKCMAEALFQYKRRQEQFPKRIIIYRDGVGDGQLAYIHEHELPQVNDFIEQAGERSGFNWKPELAYMVLKKRINQRFFRTNEHGEEDNPFPGTIVDSKITRRDMYDFLLVSQKVRQGTVTPVHYNIIYDTTNLNADKFQQLTYKLTHLYYNWPGTVRVPAPCQYAHKLATLIGDHLHQEVADGNLCEKLYYL